MSTIVIVKKGGPDTFQPASGVAVAGGQVVVPSGTAGRIGVAGAATKVALGIAVTDGIAPEDFATDPVGGVLNAAQNSTWITVAYGGMTVDGVKYAANAAFGDKLKSAASGAVTPMADGDDPRLEVGTCVQLGGVLANATGLVRTK